MRNYIYAFIMISFWIGIVFRQDKLYIYFAVFGLIAYFVYRTYTEDIMKNKYKDDPRLYKITTIIVQAILIIYQLIFFMTLEDGHKVSYFAKNEFLIVLSCFMLVILWLSYYLSKKLLSKIFVEKDSYRKTFVILQILYLLFFTGFTIYNMININRFDFYLDRLM
ncbi:hypothetical protein [Peptoniphilus gorbachii]|uniref:Kef-type K+ transport system membrane component KefB n=1 Tax=Peptoniphilus gorbachii TaxID=411567 RepID=A0ABS2MI98_9FIRM|nr:hypothetical protein [Peptoniphilus gorbachii]MBM7549739.1 Kef-type K+ transport system membrane component KefB [Peptoniphilus gorbachii]